MNPPPAWRPLARRSTRRQRGCCARSWSSLFHSRISVALNLKLLDPHEVIAAAETAWREGLAPLAAAGWLARLLLVPEENSVSADVAQVSEEYSDAWNNYDGAAFLGLVTADYQFYETAGQLGEDAEGTAAMISNDLEGFDWAVEQQGAAQMIGDENTVHVSSLDFTSTNVGPDNEGVSVLTLVNQDGVWKVKQHIFDGR